MALTVIRTRRVTLPVFKIVPNVPLYVRADGPMHTGKKIDDQKEPATLMHVTNAETGEVGQIICGAVLAKELESQYPGESYVGKWFEIVSTRVPEKKYNIYSISEIADPRSEEAQRAEVEQRKAIEKATGAQPSGKAKATA